MSRLTRAARRRLTYLRFAVVATVVVLCSTAPMSCSPQRRVDGEALPAVKQVVIDAAQAQAKGQALAATEPERAAGIQRRTTALLARESEMLGWVLPLLQSYLPEGAALPMRVILDVDLSEPIAARDGVVLVDVGSPVFGEADEVLWNGIMRALYRQALSEVMTPPRTAPQGLSPAEFALHLLARLQFDGMVAYVAAQGRPDDSTREAYEVLETRDATIQRFFALDGAFQSIQRDAARSTAVAAELDVVDAKDSLYAVVGGEMARAIEGAEGREGLVAAIVGGPMRFYDAYQKTGPGALVNFRVPSYRAAKPDDELVTPSAG